MERISAALFLTLLVAVSAAVHLSLPGRPPTLAQPAVETVVVLAQAEPGSAIAVDEAPEPAAEASPNEGAEAISPEKSYRPLSSEELVQDRRGFWLTEEPRGRAIRLDAGPVPRQSALVPILMYHYIRPIDFSKSDAATSSLTLPPAQLEQQLRYLRDRGFKSATMADLYLYFQGRRDLPSRSVILTFDDGYWDNYVYAYPLLLRYGFKGTFFIVTGFVGRSEYMTWPQLREMVAGGMEVGAHTVSHVDLARISPTARERELVESRRGLQDTLGVSVRSLAYPSGAYNQEAIQAARKAGYEIAVTTQYGATHDRGKLMELPRVRVQGTDTPSVFRWRIEQYFPATGPASY